MSEMGASPLVIFAWCSCIEMAECDCAISFPTASAAVLYLRPSVLLLQTSSVVIGKPQLAAFL